MMGDDAWYILLAKSLADGKGYWLTNAPLAGILPQYPPGFPALLSLVFQLHPQFPGNVWLLKSVSIAAMLGVASLTYFYLHAHRQLPRHLAALASVAVATTPALVFLATSTVMSECVFTLTQLATLVVAQRTVEAPSERRSRAVVLAGLLGAATVIIRSAGFAVVAAVFLMLLKERLSKRAALFAVVILVCLGPWLLYSRAHAPTAAQQEVHRGSIVYGYGEQFWMRWAGSPSTGRVSMADLPARAGRNAVDLFGRGIGGIFAPALLRGPEESGEEVVSLGGDIGWMFAGLGGTPANMAVSFAFAAIVIWGFVRCIRERATAAELLVALSLALTLTWPFHVFRFVLPLTPLLYLYLVKGLSSHAIARIALLVIIGLNVFDHAGYVVKARSNPDDIDWIARYRQVDTAVEWMRSHLDGATVVAATNPALVHLRTGRQTITLDTLTENWSVWKGRGAGYLACLVPRDLPSHARGPYKVLYQSPAEGSPHAWVIEIR